MYLQSLSDSDDDGLDDLGRPRLSEPGSDRLDGDTALNPRIEALLREPVECAGSLDEYERLHAMDPFGLGELLAASERPD